MIRSILIILLWLLTDFDHCLVSAWRYQCCTSMICVEQETIGCNGPCQVIYHPTNERVVELKNGSFVFAWQQWFNHFGCATEVDRYLDGHVGLHDHYVCNIRLEQRHTNARLTARDADDPERRLSVACYCREHKCNALYLYEIMKFADDKLRVNDEFWWTTHKHIPGRLWPQASSGAQTSSNLFITLTSTAILLPRMGSLIDRR